MDNMHVDTGAIKGLAKNINIANESIKTGFDNMSGSVFGRLMQDWESPAAAHAMKRFNDIRRSFYQNRYDVMNNCAVFLERIVGEGYENTENNNVSLADMFK